MAFRDTAKGAQFEIRVQPRASRNAITGVMGEAIKVAVTAPPVDGKANLAVIQLLAELLHVPKSSIEVVSGDTGRNKLIAVAGMRAEEVEKRLRSYVG